MGKETYELPILVSRDLTVAATKRASSYHLGDVIQYRKGNREVGVKAKEYATVLDGNTDGNQITVKTRGGRIVTYNPARASGINLFESRLQEFSAGERIQFTAKDKKLGTHTRDMATIRSLDRNGNVEVVLDRNNKVVKFNLEQHRHVDHGYVMTSHSAQSQTVERCLININSFDPRLRGLLNEVFAYVGASRPEYDLRLFADQASELYRVLSRENEEQKAHSPEQIAEYREQLLEMTHQPVWEVEHGYDGLGV
jgi:ATP-dependent exoDNAse (exonuclease V) alpha subunit